MYLTQLHTAIDEISERYGFITREVLMVIEVLLEIPYQPDEWSVQAWCYYVSDKHGWTNTYGNQWQTDSPSRKLRETVFLHKKDSIGLIRAGVDIANGIYRPTYTHLQIKKTRVFICAGDSILDEADIARITNYPATLDLFNQVESLKILLGKPQELP